MPVSLNIETDFCHARFLIKPDIWHERYVPAMSALMKEILGN
jgi:hypothetical protein